MIFDENDINFDTLSDREFEELCFDLLMKLGFHSLVWRQGGADSGRDIEAIFTATNPLLKAYNEKWFFECKRYTKGVPVDELSSKLSWADAERPRHLTIFVSSYLSNSTRTWLEKMSVGKMYETHVIEGKLLKDILLGFPELVERYFSDRYLKLLAEAKRNWIVLDILPSPETIYFIAKNVDLRKFSDGELVFLWSAMIIKKDEVEAWCDDKSLELDINNIGMQLKDRCKEMPPIPEQIMSLNIVSSGGRVVQTIGRGGERNVNLYMFDFMYEEVNQRLIRCIYSIYALNNQEGIETFVKTDGDFSCKLRYISSDIQEEIGVKSFWTRNPK